MFTLTDLANIFGSYRWDAADNRVLTKRSNLYRSLSIVTSKDVFLN